MTFMYSYCADIFITLAEEWQGQILDLTFTDYCIVIGNMLQQGKLQKIICRALHRRIKTVKHIFGDLLRVLTQS